MYIRSQKQVLEFVQRLSDSSDSLISSRLDDIFFSSRSKNEKLFFCAEFSFFFFANLFILATARLYCQWWWWWLLCTHMYISYWGTSVSKHMEEFLFSRAIMKKIKFYIWELYKVRRCRSIIFLVKDFAFSFYFAYGW